MAAAQVATRSTPLENEATADVSSQVAEPRADVRLAIHDTSRLEWAVSVPLPREGNTTYAIEVDLEVPAHVLAMHSPWDHLQELARLDQPDDTVPSVATIDGLRRFAVGVAAKMARAHEGFGRHARLAISPFATDDVAAHIAALASWIHTAEATLDEARVRLHAAQVDHASDLTREALLADEYLSLRFIELLAGSERTLATVYDRAELASAEDPATKRLVGASPLVADVGEVIADALSREMDARSRAGYIEADADSPQGLERYLDRASQLKKHFQEVLFLDSERFTVTDRFHHFVAGGVAVLASTWAFVGQLYLTRGSLSAKVGSSLFILCILAGVVYAVKDRIKEVGRAWFASNVHRFYAQRIARYRAPAKTCPSRDIVVRARESFLRENETRPDPLNPHSNATLSITTLRYRHQGTLESSPTLTSAGIARVKHVFRYDLSPLFARLDDATKPVPLVDPKTRRVRFTQAPRCYRVPVRLTARVGGTTTEQRGAIVLHKRGLERIDLE
jgi:hypothetical protein